MSSGGAAIVSSVSPAASSLSQQQQQTIGTALVSNPNHQVTVFQGPAYRGTEGSKAVTLSVPTEFDAKGLLCSKDKLKQMNLKALNLLGSRSLGAARGSEQAAREFMVRSRTICAALEHLNQLAVEEDREIEVGIKVSVTSIGLESAPGLLDAYADFFEALNKDDLVVSLDIEGLRQSRTLEHLQVIKQPAIGDGALTAQSQIKVEAHGSQILKCETLLEASSIVGDNDDARRNVASIRHLSRVQYVDPTSFRFVSDLLTALEMHPGLRTLTLRDTVIDEGTVAALALTIPKIPNLCRVDLTGNFVTAEARTLLTEVLTGLQEEVKAGTARRVEVIWPAKQE
jgi:hypothetical protein